jgi:hypothetical protein
MKGAQMNIEETAMEMAEILLAIQPAVDELNESWGETDNDARFVLAITAVEALMARGKVLASAVKLAAREKI